MGISLTHQGKFHYIQYHHIFPKALLKGKYEKQEIFVSGRMNREISATEPGKYFPDIIRTRGKEDVILQAIPLDPNVHITGNYRAFLEARRGMLTDELNAFLEKAKGG